MYYYKNGVFEDLAMHSANKENKSTRNKQSKNWAKCYVHGTCFDLCLSNQEDVYLSFLVRGIIVNDKAIYGPINVYNVVKPLQCDSKVLFASNKKIKTEV